MYSFVSIAIASFLMMLVFILLNNNSFEKKIHLKTKISNALGIETHPPIIFKGFEIGRVTSFDFDDNLDVNVNFFVYEKYAKLINNKSIVHSVRNYLLTGIIIDFYIFSSPNGQKGLYDGDFLASSESGRGRVIAQNYGINIKEPGVNEVVRRFDVLLKEIDDQNIVGNMGFVAKRLKDTVHLVEDEVLKFKSEGGVEVAKGNLADITGKMYVMFENLNELIGDFKGRDRSISSTVDRPKMFSIMQTTFWKE